MTKKQKKTDSSPSPAITHFPSPIEKKKPRRSNEEKIRMIAERFKEIMEILGLDVSHESLVKTPERVAKMYVQEVFAGLDEENFPPISFFQDEFHHEHRSHMVFVKVEFTSFCEHHFVPMTGFAYVAYLPGEKLIGLSKIPRVVRYFASRPQLQERMTAQIADSLAILLQSDDVAVSLHAQHFCVMARGIRDKSSRMITNVLRGRFHEEEKIRQEFFEGIGRQEFG